MCSIIFIVLIMFLITLIISVTFVYVAEIKGLSNDWPYSRAKGTAIYYMPIMLPKTKGHTPCYMCNKSPFIYDNYISPRINNKIGTGVIFRSNIEDAQLKNTDERRPLFDLLNFNPQIDIVVQNNSYSPLVTHKNTNTVSPIAKATIAVSKMSSNLIPVDFWRSLDLFERKFYAVSIY